MTKYKRAVLLFSLTYTFAICCSIFVTSFCPAADPQTASPMAAAGTSPAPAATSRPDFGIWTRNSIQPPPAFEPIKLPPTTTQPGDGQTEAVYRAAIAWFDWAIEQVDKMAPPAEIAADRLIAGGNVYCGGSQGFMDELYGRAGGLSTITHWRGDRLEKNDVLIAGLLTPRDEGNRTADLPNLANGDGRINQAMVVHFASHRWPLMERLLEKARTKGWSNRVFIDTGAPAGATWADVSLQQMATVAMAWAFQGEVFAAATRKGKTLATLGSDCEPNGPKWDKSVEGKMLHPKYTLPPIPAGQIGKEYLRTCQKQVAQFLIADQPRQVRLAAGRMAAKMQAGGSVFVVVGGHLHIQGAIIPRELPNVIMYGRNWEWRPSILKKEDVFLHLGYLDYPRDMVKSALAAGADAVTVSVAEGPTDEKRTHILGCWANWDSTVNVPDYPVRILPSSGVVQTPQWYSLMAETLQKMKK
ncbi:MAG: hypothetical protein ACE15C_06845 [Phycisphaerae bacterium]